MKLYIVVAVWRNTKDNHAGMYYLAQQIKERSELSVKIIPTPTRGSRFLYWAYRAFNVLIGCWLLFTVRKNDVVFLMEYLLRETEQSDIARMLKGRCRVEGIAHLVPERIDREYPEDQIRRKAGYLSRLYVLGTSLRTYFVQKGIPVEKVMATYHYVDTEYYTPLAETGAEETPLRVICMGNMERNYDDLIKIISDCPEMQFIVCMGKNDISSLFAGLGNVILHGFLDEWQLLRFMQHSDVSLNVMKDTVGSNVITTSLACGLAVVASNVGSIGDYIQDRKNGILFNCNTEAVKALRNLARKRTELFRMQTEARRRAEELGIDGFIRWFENQMLPKRKTD